MNGDQEIVSLVARLGFTPLRFEVPGLERLREISRRIGEIEDTPHFLELVARRERGEISGTEFLTALDALIDAPG